MVRRRDFVAGLSAAFVIAVLAVFEFREVQAPERGYGESIESFILEVRDVIDAQPLPVVFWNAGSSHLQAYLGMSRPDGTHAVAEALAAHRQFYVLAGFRRPEVRQLPELRIIRRANVQLEPIVESPMMPRTENWPARVTLYRVTKINTE